jgi:protein SCO1/2
LYCFHYDPAAGKYSAIISRILQLSGGVTLLLVGALVVVLYRRGPEQDPRRQDRSHSYVQ